MIHPKFVRVAILFVLVPATLWSPFATGQEAEETEEAPKVWSNQADVGMVLTSGNSRNNTISFDNQLTADWTDSSFRLRLGAYRQTSDDITRLAYVSGDDIVPGELSFEELDQLRLYLNGSYRRNISERFFWTAGASWDRDVDAGIESRIVGFAGVGNTWWDTDALSFSTEYTFAYEYRNDEIDDPEIDQNRPTIRLAWVYSNQLFSKGNSVLTNDMDFFLNLKKASAYRFVNNTALTIGMTDLLSLRTSVEFRYDNFPGLEAVDLWSADPNVDPDASIIGATTIRKQKLDTIFKLTLVFTL